MEIVNDKITGCTYVELMDFVTNAGLYKKHNPKERSKLTYALEKLPKQYQKHVDAFNAKCSDKRVELASVDEKKNLIIAETFKDTSNAQTRYTYTSENQRKLNDALVAISKEVITEPLDMFHVEIPQGIHPSYLAVFTPFVFAPLTPEEELAWYENQGKWLKEKEEEEKVRRLINN